MSEKMDFDVTKYVETFAALAAVFEGGPALFVEYFEYTKDYQGDKTIPAVYGDIIVIINALEDYARLLLEGREAYRHKIGPVNYYLYELQAQKCLKIAYDWSLKVGYDREAALEKAKKPPKVVTGLDGLTAWATKATQAKEEAQTLQQAMIEQRQAIENAKKKKREEGAKKAAETRRRKKLEAEKNGK